MYCLAGSLAQAVSLSWITGLSAGMITLFSILFVVILAYQKTRNQLFCLMTAFTLLLIHVLGQQAYFSMAAGWPITDFMWGTLIVFFVSVYLLFRALESGYKLKQYRNLKMHRH
jgi:hypothetical protein